MSKRALCGAWAKVTLWMAPTARGRSAAVKYWHCSAAYADTFMRMISKHLHAEAKTKFATLIQITTLFSDDYKCPQAPLARTTSSVVVRCIDMPLTTLVMDAACSSNNSSNRLFALAWTNGSSLDVKSSMS